MIPFPSPAPIETNGITLEVHLAGPQNGAPIVLCHGFPEIAYSWRHQMAPLVDAGFRVIAPNQRGYAGSSRPAEVAAYDVFHLMDDLCGLIEALGHDRAVFVGHDWGALLLWQMALIRPERFRGLIALNIPFAPRRAIDPMVMTRELLGDDFYIVNFQDSDEADRAFDADPERFLRAMYRKLPTTRAEFDAVPASAKRPFSMLREMRKAEYPGSPLLSDDELAVYVEAFRRSGFTPPINWYRNWSRNWAMTADVEQRVRVPTLFIGAEDDILIAPAHVETMRRHVDDLEVAMIERCGHWTQQEQPERCNALMLDWLGRRCPPDAGATRI